MHESPPTRVAGEESGLKRATPVREWYLGGSAFLLSFLLGGLSLLTSYATGGTPSTGERTSYLLFIMVALVVVMPPLTVLIRSIWRKRHSDIERVKQDLIVRYIDAIEESPLNPASRRAESRG